MGWQATDNLRFYLAEAVLPEMIHGPFIALSTPQEGPNGLNVLTVRPEQYRVLETIRRFRKPWFTDSVKECEPHCCVCVPLSMALTDCL